MTHIEALDLDRVPPHLIVLGGGYIGLEFAQTARRFGSRATLIERGPQLAGREDSDIAAEFLKLFHAEGIDVLLGAAVTRVDGRSAVKIRVSVDRDGSASIIDGPICSSRRAGRRTPEQHSVLDAGGRAGLNLGDVRTRHDQQR